MPKLTYKIDHKKFTHEYDNKLACLINAIKSSQTFQDSQNKEAIYKAIYQLDQITPIIKESLPIQLLLVKLRACFFEGHKTHDGLRELVSYITTIHDQTERQDEIVRALDRNSVIWFLFNVNDVAHDESGIRFYSCVIDNFRKKAQPALEKALKQLKLTIGRPGFFNQQNLETNLSDAVTAEHVIRSNP